jgi:hypothetical protein
MSGSLRKRPNWCNAAFAKTLGMIDRGITKVKLEVEK